MLNVRLAGDHLFGKLLFTYLSLVMSIMVSFCAVLFPRDVLDEILNLIESVSEGFYAPAYSKNSGRALSVTPVCPIRPSVRLSARPSVRPTFVSGP